MRHHGSRHSSCGFGCRPVVDGFIRLDPDHQLILRLILDEEALKPLFARAPAPNKLLGGAFLNCKRLRAL